ncbi:MAG: ABC-F family ATP-binding cassette domain-containing protein [Candidatus Roizmanbacteria bacterium]
METIIRFDKVTFTYRDEKQILDEVGFSVRKGMKVALMGQNGAGKSTLFKLLTGTLKPTSGQISVDKSMTVATAHQVIDQLDKELTIEQYFTKACNQEPHEVRRRMASVLNAVNLHAPNDRLVKSFSGGQQARLLLASALIQNPDLLLLDEPTNNLDQAGIDHLMYFLMSYENSVIVISHDADFLNSFTQGVLYLDSHTRKVEQYAGNYHDVVKEIEIRIERQNRQNAQMEKGIRDNKEKANFFANKGGKMRNVAKKMREKIEQLESEKVEVRKEDKTIRPFSIPVQQNIVGEVLKINSYTIIHNHTIIKKKSNIFLLKDKHLLVIGPNGIGKSTLIDSIAKGTAEGAILTPGVRLGYYSQDFSTLNYDDTAWDSLSKAMLETGAGVLNEQRLRSVAAGFLITGDLMGSRIRSLSEGQKGLLSFARLVLMEPGLLILDEPTNHINFRHIPVIAQAISEYKGALILVSHVPEFVSQIKIHERLDLEK